MVCNTYDRIHIIERYFLRYFRHPVHFPDDVKDWVAVLLNTAQVKRYCGNYTSLVFQTYSTLTIQSVPTEIHPLDWL